MQIGTELVAVADCSDNPRLLAQEF